MPIQYDASARTFHLSTPKSSYVLGVSDHGFLVHYFYGGKISDNDLSYVYQPVNRSLSPNPNEEAGRAFSLDHLPQEYPGNGTGDFRTPAVVIRTPGGHTATSFRYVSHRIMAGKPALAGLPATYAADSQADTLEILLKDAVSGAEAALVYTAFRSADVITRSVRIRNGSEGPLYLERVSSLAMDFDHMDYDLITLWGGWANERRKQRAPLRHGSQGMSSVRGASSPQANPFFAIVSPDAGESHGEVYGFNFVYSGNFLYEASCDQYSTTRVTMGIHPQDFEWMLASGETFTAPEVVCVYSGEGLGEMSRTYHRLYRDHLCRGPWKHARRPVLVNNWEATYFDFDGEKLIRIAEDAKALGIEMLVMDDGWFGARSSDDSSLGDWFVNEGKLKMPLSELADRVNALGLKFGIWFEPEMVSEKSRLYEAHPDWCLRVPGRELSRGRGQLVLDLSREDVQDYLFSCLSEILSGAKIAYVKWDMNRNITEAGSALLESRKQKEVFHRYILGVYALLERLLAAFPDLLLEGCASGGGRYDPGMLYYSPQIWTSDDTDAIERIGIQLGTSLCYPVSAMGAHVSVCPNHITGRTTPLETRGVVAMSGTFGFELDLTKLSDAEKAVMKRQTAEFKAYYDTISYGDLYRLTDWETNTRYAAWCFVSPEKDDVIFNFIQIRGEGNGPLYRIRLQGLDPKKRYRNSVDGRVFCGDTLLHSGLCIPMLTGDGVSYQCRLQAV